MPCYPWLKTGIRRFLNSIGEICGSPLPSGCRRRWRKVKKRKPGTCAVARRLGEFVYDVRFETTQSDRGRSKCLHDFTRERHPVQGCALGPRPCRRCARCSKVRSLFEKCASWKTPRIPSKMRTSFQGAHGKLRTFERRTGAGRSTGAETVRARIELRRRRSEGVSLQLQAVLRPSRGFLHF
jgi:hypothetical protein